MKVKTPATLLQAASLTEDQARQLLEQVRWPNGPVCPHCKQSERIGVLNGEKHRKGLYKCYGCRKQFTVTVGTMMHRSHITLRQWVVAFYSICAHKKGVSALQLQRDLGLGSYEAAWHLAHRIREAMNEEPMQSLIAGAVEVDETYVGGKSRQGKRGRGSERKTPVVAVIGREGGIKVASSPNVGSKALKTIITGAVEPSATIYTDEWPGYNGIGMAFAGGHETVCHGQKEYARGSAHVNHAESFFALLKRGVHGTFHSISKKHLDRYCDEFAFRWNLRDTTDGQRTVAAMSGMDGKRLEYKVLVGRG